VRVQVDRVGHAELHVGAGHLLHEAVDPGGARGVGVPLRPRPRSDRHRPARRHRTKVHTHTHTHDRTTHTHTHTHTTARHAPDCVDPTTEHGARLCYSEIFAQNRFLMGMPGSAVMRLHSGLIHRVQMDAYKVLTSGQDGVIGGTLLRHARHDTHV